MNSKKTKGALFSSVIALVLCFTMLLGTTFAWFTDEVTSANNIIKAGNLDVKVTNDDGDIQDQSALFDGILWEPGVVAYENLTVANVGTLALKYNMSINFTDENFVVEADGATTSYGLSTALKVAVLEEKINTGDRDALLAYIEAKQVEWTSLKDLVEKGELYPEGNKDQKPSTKDYGIVIYWEPGDDDNNWNVQNGKTTSDKESYLHIDLGINLYATQFTYEEDSFDHLYDEDADLPVYGIGSGADALLVENASAYEIPVIDVDTEEQVGFAVVYKDALAGSIEDVEIQIRETDLYEGLGVVIGDGEEAVTYNVDIIGLNNSGENTKVGLKAVPGYNTATIYHYDEKIGVVSYNAGESYVEFLTDDFSPFTVVYSNVEEGTLPDGLPQAVVTDKDDAENVSLDWKAFGPVSAADAQQQLYSVYTFAAPHDATTVENCQYKAWECDYYVSVDQAIDAGTIFLGGNYGSYGWVGFTNPEAVQANVDIPLLGSVSQSAWTYEDIVSFVGTFHCGVAEAYDHVGELAGVTFTVKLRLTDPDDETKYYDVNTVKYTFEKNTEAGTAEDLADALTKSDKVELTANVTTAQVNMNGNTLDGNGNTIAVKNAADATTNYGIATTGGTIQNVTITGETTAESGKGFRAVYASNATEDIVLNKVTIDATYCININDNDYAGSLYVTDSTLNGWISYGSAEKAVFTGCTFGESTTGYANLRPYANTTLTDCNFAEGYTITRHNIAGDKFTITLTNCTVGEKTVTAENFAQLLCGDAADAYALQTCGWVTVIVDGVAVEF